MALVQFGVQLPLACNWQHLLEVQCIQTGRRYGILETGNNCGWRQNRNARWQFLVELANHGHELLPHCSAFQASVRNRCHWASYMSWTWRLQPMCWAMFCGRHWTILVRHTQRTREGALCSGRSCKPTTISATSSTSCSTIAC